MTYPIDTEATKGKWVLYDTITRTHARMSDTGNWPTSDGREIPGLAPNLVPLLRVTSEKPTYNPDASTIEEIEVIDIGAGELRTEYRVIPLPPESIAASRAYNAAADIFAALPLGKQALWEPVRAKVSESLLSGDFPKAKEILQTTPAIYPGADEDLNLFLALFP